MIVGKFWNSYVDHFEEAGMNEPEMIAPSKISVGDNDEKLYDATVAASDENKDVAVLYVPGLELEPVKLGDSDSLMVEIDKILDDLRSSGKLSELSIKYFGEDLTNP